MKRANLPCRAESPARTILSVSPIPDDHRTIERILNGYTNTCAAYSEWVSCIREYVRRKLHGAEGAVPETAHILEVGKQLQVLTVDFAIKRAVEVFTVHWRHRWCESVLVKELLPSRKGRLQTILADNRWQRCAVGCGFGKIRLTMRHGR